MAKRGGLGRGLDALIPDRKSEKTEKRKRDNEEKTAKAGKSSKGAKSGAGKSETAAKAEEKEEKVSSGKAGAGKSTKAAPKSARNKSSKKSGKTVDALKALDEEIAKALQEDTSDYISTEESSTDADDLSDVHEEEAPANEEFSAIDESDDDEITSDASVYEDDDEEFFEDADDDEDVDDVMAEDDEDDGVAEEDEATEDEAVEDDGLTEEEAAYGAESFEEDKETKSSAGEAVNRYSKASKADQDGNVISMRISLVEPNRSQPRKYFDDDAINELADSVRQFGIIQPLLVQKKEDYYEIIAGERRWRAAQKAGLKEVPVIVKNFTSQEAVEVSLIENIQREDLNPIEEAKAYERLVKEYGLSQEAVAGRVSKSRSSVTNAMRLLKLDESVQRMVETGELSEGHARAILGIPMIAAQKDIADVVVKEKMSVRQTEKLVRDTVHPKTSRKGKRVNPVDEAILNDLAEQLKVTLGTRVAIHPGGRKGGKIEIEYYSDDDLDRLFELLHSVRS